MINKEIGLLKKVDLIITVSEREKRGDLKDKDYRTINGLIPGQRILYRYETCFSHRIPLFKAVGFSCLSRISLIGKGQTVIK